MKKERDYSTGKIYKIWSFNSPDIYIGSTIQALSERLRGHLRSLYSYKKSGKNYCASFIILENEHYDIELIEYCPCKTKEELCRREGELQREMNCINKNIAGRSKKEWGEDNKEHCLKKNKEWREDNKEKLAEKQKEYNEKNKEKLAKKQKEYNEKNKEVIAKQRKKYRENNKEELAKQRKKYRENNKEPIAKKKKEFYEKNIDKIKENKKIRIICECGTDIAKDKKSRHKKSLLHINLMEEKKKYIKIKILKNPPGC